MYRSVAQRTVWAVTVVALFLFLFAPLLIVVAVSFNAGTTIEFPPSEFTLDWYVRVFQNEDFAAGFRVSIVVAVVVATLTVLIGVPIAYAITRYSFFGQKAISALFLAPLLVPTIAIALGLLVLFSTLGLFGTTAGLVMGHFAVAIPYTVRTTAMGLAAVRPEYLEAARSLGAGKIAVFRRVTLPLIRNGVAAGAIMSLIVSFDETVISLFIVGSDRTTLPVELFRYVEFRSDPMIAALATILILASVLGVVAIERLAGLRRVIQ